MVYAVVFAGGVGTRLKTADIPKQFIKVEGKPIIVHTMQKFEQSPYVDGIIIACLKDWIEELEREIDEYDIKKVKKIVPGGASGHASIHNALSVIAKDYKQDDIVLICDGVRPMISLDLVKRCIEETKEYGNAVPVTQSIDSVLESQDGVYCRKSYLRKDMFITQAPQGYYMKDIWWAHNKAEELGILNPISSAELMLELGQKVHVFIGERQNIKVTTPEDIYTLRSGYYYEHYRKFAKEELSYE